MNKLAVILVIGVGLSAAAGVYWFQANRLTGADIKEAAEAQKKVDELEKPKSAEQVDGQAAPEATAELDKSGRPKPSKEQQRESAKEAVEQALAARKETATASPGVTVIANESMPDKTPDKFTALFETTKGPFAVEFTREWAPNGVDRMYDLILHKFFTDMRVFRVVEGFVVQFGIPGDPRVTKQWDNREIPDDPVTQKNTDGMFTFAAGGVPNTRSTQVFINLVDNSSRLDHLGFAPIGKVIFGMDVVKSLYSGYGESITNLQDRIMLSGNAFLDNGFPGLDSIKRAVFVEEIKDIKATEQRMQEANLKKLEDIASGEVSRGVSELAPATFKAKFECTKGTFIVECTREWSPNGADRFYTLVKNGFYNGAKFFRVVPGFIVQFGMPAEPDVRGTWITSTFPDDPFKVSNTAGTVTFAMPPGINNGRSTQVFINFADNSALDLQKFTPFGKIIEGMDVVNKINAEYGEKPNQGRVRTEGNSYLEENFPRLDGIKTATIVDEANQPAAGSNAAPSASNAPLPAAADSSAPAAAQTSAQ